MRRLNRVLLLLLVLAGATLSLSCSPTYVLRAGWHEARILSRRRPITSVIADPATSEQVRRKLQLVLDARQYAQHGLALETGESFTTYSWVERDTLLMVLSAAYADRFAPHTWWFPIVGRVPYKGYFDFRKAYAEAERLEGEGFDTYVRPSGAFSTLGWFNDPLLNTVLRYDEVSLANTVIHELVHNTMYLPGQAGFNESFANFVGDRGAIDFFCSREGEASRECAEAKDDWSDNLVFGAFLSDLVHRLETLYARTDIDRAARLAEKERLLQDSKRRFAADVRPKLRTSAYLRFDQRPLNNAVLIGMRLYYEQLDLFEAVYQRYQGDLPAAIAAVIAAARGEPDRPFEAAGRLLR